MRWRGQPVAAILGGAPTTTSKLRGPARPPPASTWESEYDRRARQIFHQTHITPLNSEGSRRRRCRHQPPRQEVSRLGRRGAEAQFLQLGHLYRRDDARGLQRGERHRRQYEPVCHQRRAVRQAARRQSRLRRHRSGQRVCPAHDPGQPARAARSRQDPEHQERRAGVHQGRAVRSRPQVQHALYLARHRHRLSQVQGQGGPR